MTNDQNPRIDGREDAVRLRHEQSVAASGDTANAVRRALLTAAPLLTLAACPSYGSNAIPADDGAIAPGYEWVFDITIDFGERWRFPVVGGGLIGFTSIAGGIIEGPKLQGRVMPASGADFARIRPDGVVELDANYLLEAADGTPIYCHNIGRGRAPPVPLARGEEPKASEMADHYFRLTPQFQTPPGVHDWLTKVVIVGAAQRKRNPDRTVFHYYTVT
jgi:hypothetical protein